MLGFLVPGFYFAFSVHFAAHREVVKPVSSDGSAEETGTSCSTHL